MAVLDDCPDAILLNIISRLHRAEELKSLSLASHRLCDLVNPLLQVCKKYRNINFGMVCPSGAINPIVKRPEHRVFVHTIFLEFSDKADPRLQRRWDNTGHSIFDVNFGLRILNAAQERHVMEDAEDELQTEFEAGQEIDGGAAFPLLYDAGEALVNAVELLEIRDEIEQGARFPMLLEGEEREAMENAEGALKVNSAIPVSHEAEQSEAEEDELDFRERTDGRESMVSAVADKLWWMHDRTDSSKDFPQPFQAEDPEVLDEAEEREAMEKAVDELGIREWTDGGAFVEAVKAGNQGARVAVLLLMHRNLDRLTIHFGGSDYYLKWAIDKVASLHLHPSRMTCYGLYSLTWLKYGEHRDEPVSLQNRTPFFLLPSLETIFADGLTQTEEFQWGWGFGVSKVKALFLNSCHIVESALEVLLRIPRKLENFHYTRRGYNYRAEEDYNRDRILDIAKRTQGLQIANDNLEVSFLLNELELELHHELKLQWQHEVEEELRHEEELQWQHELQNLHIL